MKRFGLIFLAGLFAFGIVYMLGSFSNSSFNIAFWTDYSRTIVSVFGGLISTLVMIFTFFKTED